MRQSPMHVPSCGRSCGLTKKKQRRRDERTRNLIPIVPHPSPWDQARGLPHTPSSPEPDWLATLGQPSYLAHPSRFSSFFLRCSPRIHPAPGGAHRVRGHPGTHLPARLLLGPNQPASPGCWEEWQHIAGPAGLFLLALLRDRGLNRKSCVLSGATKPGTTNWVSPLCILNSPSLYYIFSGGLWVGIKSPPQTSLILPVERHPPPTCPHTSCSLAYIS